MANCILCDSYSRGGAPGYVENGRWPNWLSSLVGGQMFFHYYFAKCDTQHSLGQRPMETYNSLARKVAVTNASTSASVL